jgi:molybdate transport system substrate-binding protein
VTVTPTFDSSGTLKTQIQEGAACDIFISAAQKQMNQLDITASADVNTEGLDFVLPDTRTNLLENKVVLVVPEGNPAGIRSFDELKNAGLIALGNSDVPVGSYSLEILAYLGLDVMALEEPGRITSGTNVKEVTTQVSEGTVDCASSMPPTRPPRDWRSWTRRQGTCAPRCVSRRSHEIHRNTEAAQAFWIF